MSNEIANRSHAGLVVQVFPDPDPPKLLLNWGFDAASLTRESAIGAGLYSIRLTDPGSGLVGPTPSLLESIDKLITKSVAVEAPGFLDSVLLVPDPALPAPAVGDNAQLPILLLQVKDDGGPIDAGAVFQVAIHSVPQQD